MDDIFNILLLLMFIAIPVLTGIGKALKDRADRKQAGLPSKPARPRPPRPAPKHRAIPKAETFGPSVETPPGKIEEPEPVLEEPRSFFEKMEEALGLPGGVIEPIEEEPPGPPPVPIPAPHRMLMESEERGKFEPVRGHLRPLPEKKTPAAGEKTVDDGTPWQVVDTSGRIRPARASRKGPSRRRRKRSGRSASAISCPRSGLEETFAAPS